MMRLDEDRDRWVALVRGAQAGDPPARAPLIARFENLAVGSAVGLCGDLDEAPDIAQEAFATAARHIGSLEDPMAFPAWLLTLVRSATTRRARRRRHGTEPLDALGDDHRGVAATGGQDGEPERTVIARAEAAQVRQLIEELPEGERCVVALHYVADMPYTDVAAFLGISVSAAKKRAWAARTRLKEQLPVATDALVAARPSRTTEVRDSILVFQAIRAGDADLLDRLLRRDPSLANAREDWTAAEGFGSNLSFSEGATALVRAVRSGDVRLLRLLVEAGAEVDGVCGCADRESALITAVNLGAVDAVEYLLEQGAPVDDVAFDGGSTALHVAVHRERHELVRLLLAAGADPTVEDGSGRTAADWSILKNRRRPATPLGDLLTTGIRAVDLFAPSRRGALVHIPPAYGLGAMRTVYGIVDAFDARFWMLGFEHGPFQVHEFGLEVRESGTPSTIDLVGPGHPTERRHQFATTLERLTADPGRKVVMVVPAPGHEHDVTVALPGLAAAPDVLATVVVSPFTAGSRAVPEGIPEGFDARITFDPVRARRRMWPAVDPSRTGVRASPSARHERIASAAREALGAYGLLDPSFDLPDPTTFEDVAAAEAAQRLVRYLCHSFRPFEHLAAAPAADTTIDELLDSVEEILDGREARRTGTRRSGAATREA